MEDNQVIEKRKSAYRVGWTILILLGVLTIGEFSLGAVGASWVAVFLLIAVLKAFFVIRDYMHAGRLFSGEEEQA